MGMFRQEGKLWAIDTKIKIDGVFKHFHKGGYETLSSAKADFERAKKEFIESKTLFRKVETFDSLVDEYEKMRSIQMNASTIEIDRSIIRTHLTPNFGGYKIEDCFKSDFIKRWYDCFVNDKRVSNARKCKVISRIKDILKYAYMHKYIGAETYQDCDVQIYQVKCNRNPLTERVIWTPEEEQAFLEALKGNDKDYLMFRLFLLCSPRLGEFLGLQPNCFDYKNKKIIIKQQIKYLSGNGKFVLTDQLKTHDSYRTIILPNGIAEELKDYISNLSLKENDFLFFARSKNEPMGRTTFKRKLKHYCEVAGVRLINPHASRHMQATKLASVCKTGDELESAARRMGHSVSVFMNTYANHTNDKKEKELLERIYQA